MTEPKNQQAIAPEEAWAALSRIYQAPGLEKGFLALQDKHGAKVLVMLYLAWLAENGLRPAQDIGLDDVLAASRWRRRLVLSPLRRIRRVLFPKKGQKNRIKSWLLAVELNQERKLLDAILARTQPFARVQPGSDTDNCLLDEYMAGIGIDASYKGKSSSIEYFTSILQSQA